MAEDFFKIVDQRIADDDLDARVYRRFENPTCQKCLQDYQKKFPGRPFGIHCEGIFDDRAVSELYATMQTSDDEDDRKMSRDEVQELVDPVFWANRHIRLADNNGDLKPFVARDYQEEILRCTARRKVDRCGRGLGKTSLGGIEELQRALTRKNYPIMVATPAKAQAQKWWDDLQQHIKNDPGIAGAVAQQRQAPYFMLRFWNGSTISIFTTGSTSGKDADTVRSQSPRRVRLDEQDLLNPGDYKAIMPLLRRFKESEFHGSSTPVGKRETFWQMCTQYPDYKEFWFPINRHPDFNAELEEACRREARTELVYQHEFLAEFGDLEAGVFKPAYVDAAKDHFVYSQCIYSPRCKYYMGIDWNGKGTGTRIRVVEFDPVTNIRRCVDSAAIDISTMATIDEIAKLNRKWHCSQINVDAGFGFVQDELLRLKGSKSTDPDDKRLQDINVVDFGASLKTNKIAPKRDRTKYINDKDSELERRTKPFMVEGCVMVFEAHLVKFSDQDIVLEEQLRAYQVKTYSQAGYANTYTADKTGDHDLDAFMLAMLAIEMKHGLYLTQRVKRLASGMVHLSSFGGTATGDPGTPTSMTDLYQRGIANAKEQAREEQRNTAGVPSRAAPKETQSQMNNRLSYLMRNNGAFIVRGGSPMPASSRTSVSRTSTLSGRGQPTSNSLPFNQRFR